MVQGIKMGKIYQQEINKFRSMTPNIRLANSNECALSCHFDIFRNGLLSPNRDYIALTDGNEKITRFIYAKNDDAGYSIYGMGDALGYTGGTTGNTAIYEKTIGTATLDWTDLFKTAKVKESSVFFEYKDIAYGWHGGTHLWSLTLTGTQTLSETYKAIAYTNVAQPIHHKGDDCAYFFEDNNVHRLNDTTFDGGTLTPVLVLPTNMKIVGGASYGIYLAIVCSPIEPGTTNSVMYLWDRDSSLTTISAKIDLGFGEAVHVSESENGGIWITQQVNASTAMGSYNNSIAIKYYNGSLYSFELPNGTETEYFSEIKLFGNPQEDRNTFYFPARFITRLAAETRNVIFATRWISGRIEIVADQEITGITANQNINGIFSLRGHWLISYNTAAKNLVTYSSSVYPTATYESPIVLGENVSLQKKLIGITVDTSPLPIAGQVLLYYRKDEETAWTLIFTNTTDNSISHSAVNIESSGATLPQFKEIQFKIESKGGAEITKIKFKYEELETNPY